MISPFTVTGTCPVCGHALKLCQAKSRAFFIGCTDYPRCPFNAAYDPVLQHLCDRNARLEAELTLLSRPQTPLSPEERRDGMQTWVSVVQERRTALTTWADVAHKWGATVRERRAE